MLVVAFICWYILCVYVGYHANNIGRSEIKYFFIGVCLTPIVALGILWWLGPNQEGMDRNALLSRKFKRCEVCGNIIEMDADYCSWCGSEQLEYTNLLIDIKNLRDEGYSHWLIAEKFNEENVEIPEKINDRGYWHQSQIKQLENEY